MAALAVLAAAALTGPAYAGASTPARGEAAVAPQRAGKPAWLGAFTVAGSGARIASVPLARPAEPFSLVRVFVQGADGSFREQAVMAVVIRDGRRALVPLDGPGAYRLRDRGLTLGELTEDLERRRGEGLGQAATEGLGVIEDAQGLPGSILGLVLSSATEAGGDPSTEEAMAFLSDLWDGVAATLEDLYDSALDLLGDDSDASDNCASDGSATTCYQPDGVDGPCDGHGGGVTTYYSDGSTYSVCADGYEEYTYCVDDDEDGVCFGEDADDDDPDVSFAPVPGPCPLGVCFVDVESGAVIQLRGTEGLRTMSDLLSFGGPSGFLPYFAPTRAA